MTTIRTILLLAIVFLLTSTFMAAVFTGSSIAKRFSDLEQRVQKIEESSHGR